MFNLFNIISLTGTIKGEPYTILLPLALILVLSKSLSILCRRAKLPQVVGLLAAGLIVGLITFIPNQNVLTDFTKTGIADIAKIGVVLIMFSAGLETNTKQIKATGVASLVVTALGVIVPMGLGFLVAYLFNVGSIASCIFYGVILSATSVSISVATLKELGKLDSKVGTAIVSAAILDDIIGVIILSFVLSVETNQGGGATDTLILVLKMIAYFVLAFGLGFIIKKVFAWLEVHYPKTRRMPIFALGICFFFAYAAEAWFGVADITGAYLAGLIFAGMDKETDYIDRRTEIGTYLIFGPVFFANIGLMMYEGSSFSDPKFIIFGICFAIVGILSKVIGCGLGAKICKFSTRDSLKVGIGMMARAEVVIVCAQKGIAGGLVKAEIMPFILLLIIASSFLTPLLLKILFKKDVKELENTASVQVAEQN